MSVNGSRAGDRHQTDIQNCLLLSSLGSGQGWRKLRISPFLVKLGKRLKIYFIPIGVYFAILIIHTKESVKISARGVLVLYDKNI